MMSLTVTDLRKSTEKDLALSRVVNLVCRGWPENLSDVPFDCIKELHHAHPGVVKTKGLAHSYIWWPQLDSEVEQK